jgi:hypothetical protein
MVILAEPSVMERLESRHPQFAQQYRQFQDHIGSIDPGPAAHDALEAARESFAQPGFWPTESTLPPAVETSPSEPPAFQNNFNTARWPPENIAQ